MLLFLTAVRHPRNATSYREVERLLARTARSICGQESDRFAAVAVVNRAPSVELPSAMEVVQVDFPPPSAEKGPQTGREAVLLDKGSKLAAGLLHARDRPWTHLMVVDADDLVSRRLAGFVSSHAGDRTAGWYIGRGWVYSDRRRLLGRINDFDEKCGTSLIVPRSQVPVPAPDINAQHSQREIISAFGWEPVRDLLGSHKVARRHAEALGAPLRPLPFRGAAYAVETGENHSGNALDHFALPLRRGVAADLGLEDALGTGGTVAPFGAAAVAAQQLVRSRLAARIKR